ncbi:hypothetical protein Leryth_022585 [Lithospermum erythrorhizon]|nr:hypothetical protein Leryth_022585 [Lithospermum erythrorhizon]
MSDVNRISVGSGTNIQDNALVHVAKLNLSGKVLPSLATMLLLVIVLYYMDVLSRMRPLTLRYLVWGGNPAKFLRKLTDEEVAFIAQSAANYTNLAQVHAAENPKSFDEIELEKVLRKKFSHRIEDYDS